MGLAPVSIKRRKKSLSYEPVSKCSNLFEVKKGENFNHRNMWDISRIEIFVCRRDRAKEGVLKLAPIDIIYGGLGNELARIEP
jgi:hypothetical protein